MNCILWHMVSRLDSFNAFTWSRREEFFVESHLVPPRYGDRHGLDSIVTELEKSRYLARHDVTAAARIPRLPPLPQRNYLHYEYKN